jgi:hypothetical protein
MILKLLIDFYRWLWGMPPLVVQPDNEPIVLAITFGVIIDIAVIIGIIGYAVTAYSDWKRGK